MFKATPPTPSPRKSLFPYGALKYATKRITIPLSLFPRHQSCDLHSCDSRAEVGLDQSHVIDKCACRYQIDTNHFKTIETMNPLPKGARKLEPEARKR